MTAITAFFIITLVFAIGEVISSKTKGWFSSFAFMIIVFVILGGTLKLLPDNLVATAGLNNILVTFGMGLTFVNLGCNLNFKELVREWKTVAIVCAGMVGVILFCFTLGVLIFGRETALAACGTICGGFGATVVTTSLANEAGRSDLAMFVTVLMSVQQLVGAPIASICLSKEAARFIKAGGMDMDIESKPSTQDPTKHKFTLKFIKEQPQWMQTPMMFFMKLSFLGFIADLVAKATGLNGTLSYMLFGFLGAETGLIERGALKKSGGEQLVLLGSFAYLVTSYLTLSIGELGAMLLPVFGLLICGAIVIMIVSPLIGKLLKWSVPASIAVGVSCLLGYPFTLGLATEAVNNYTFGKDYSEVQVRRLENHLVPKMVIGGVASVSIISVIIASVISPMIFKI